MDGPSMAAVWQRLHPPGADAPKTGPCSCEASAVPSPASASAHNATEPHGPSSEQPMDDTAHRQAVPQVKLDADEAAQLEKPQPEAVSSQQHHSQSDPGGTAGQHTPADPISTTGIANSANTALLPGARPGGEAQFTSIAQDGTTAVPLDLAPLDPAHLRASSASPVGHASSWLPAHSLEMDRFMRSLEDPLASFRSSLVTPRTDGDPLSQFTTPRTDPLSRLFDMPSGSAIDRLQSWVPSRPLSAATPRTPAAASAGGMGFRTNCAVEQTAMLIARVIL